MGSDKSAERDMAKDKSKSFGLIEIKPELLSQTATAHDLFPITTENEKKVS